MLFVVVFVFVCFVVVVVVVLHELCMGIRQVSNFFSVSEAFDMALSAIIMAGLIICFFPEEISQVPHGEDWITRETCPVGTGAGRGNSKKRGGHATTKSEKSVDAGANSTERSL